MANIEKLKQSIKKNTKDLDCLYYLYKDIEAIEVELLRSFVKLHTKIFNKQKKSELTAQLLLDHLSMNFEKRLPDLCGDNYCCDCVGALDFLKFVTKDWVNNIKTLEECKSKEECKKTKEVNKTGGTYYKGIFDSFIESSENQTL